MYSLRIFFFFKLVYSFEGFSFLPHLSAPSYSKKQKIVEQSCKGACIIFVCGYLNSTQKECEHGWKSAGSHREPEKFGLGRLAYCYRNHFSSIRSC